MSVSDREVARRAFAAPEWRAAVDALFQATGVSVSIMQFKHGDLYSAGLQCAYCHLATDIEAVGPLTCFDACPGHDSGLGRIICRAGLPALYAPVLRGERTVAHAVVTGFVTSTRERRGLYEHLLSRGINEDSARRAIKTLPIVARRQAEAYLQMAVASAHTVVEATAERLVASERIEELRLFVSAGQQVVSTERLDADTLSGIAEEAMALVGGEAAAILRPRGSYLEVAARTSDWRGAIGALIPREATAAGRAAETGRTVVARGAAAPSAAMAMPLTIGERVLGVLEIRLPQASMPLAQDRISRLNRFGQFIAIALEREDERTTVERAMAGYVALNGLAADLGGRTDMDGLSTIVSSAVDKAFDSQLCGMVLTGWGRDRADVVVNGTVAKGDVDYVLGVVSGRDLATDPFGHVRTVTAGGSIEQAAEPAGEWAISSFELRYGDLDIGWLFVARSDGERYGRQDRALLEGIAGHAGSAFGRAALFSRIRDDYAKTIAAFSAMMDVGERASTGHAGRVMEYSMMIGEELGLSVEELEQLRFAGLLHDVGKTGVPEEILLKPSKLSPDELEQVQRHSEIGATIVDQIDFLKSITPVILHHHERWDGGGYPMKLKGEAIPILARVLAVADSFDAMTSERSYSDKLTIAQARSELTAGTGTQFDPRVVAAFFESLDRTAAVGATGIFATDVSQQGRPDLLA